MDGLPTDYWGKFKDSSGEISWLPLAHHMIDVAMMFRALLDSGHGKTFGAMIAQDDLTEGQKQRLTVLAFLHDIGKATVRFQRQVFPDGLDRRSGGHTLVACSLWSERHGARFESMLPANFSEWFTSNGEDTIQSFGRMMLATIGHHGKAVEYEFDDTGRSDERVSDVRWSDNNYVDFERFMSDLESTMIALWPLAYGNETAMEASAAFMYEFNGLLTLADWMASDERYFDYHSGDGRHERTEFARRTSDRMLEIAGRSADPISSDFDEVFGFSPNPMQAAFMAANRHAYQ